MVILKFIHKLIWYIPLASIAVVLKVTSPFVGLLLAWTVRADGNLPHPISLIYQPDDSLAIGDDPAVSPWLFQDKEGAFTKDYPPYLRRVVLCYLWSFLRNPSYGWDSKVCGISKDVEIVYSKGNHIDCGEAIATLGGRFILANTGHWNLIYAFQIPFTHRGFLCSFGWNLQGEVSFSDIRNLKIDIAGKQTSGFGVEK